MCNARCHQENANQKNDCEIPTYTSDSSCWQGSGTKGAILHCLWKWKYLQAILKSTCYFLGKLGSNLPQGLAKPLLHMYSKAVKPCQKNICSSMFRAILFAMVWNWNKSRYSTTEERIKKVWYVYAMEYYSSVNNAFMVFAGKWIEQEKIIPREVIQILKEKHYIC